MSSINCSGNDNCPICQMFGSQTLVKKRLVNVIDKTDGEMKVMEISEDTYNEMFCKKKSLLEVI